MSTKRLSGPIKARRGICATIRQSVVAMLQADGCVATGKLTAVPAKAGDSHYFLVRISGGDTAKFMPLTEVASWDGETI